MTVAELKRKATDVFSFILVFCPNFPANTNTSAVREFDELVGLIHAIADATHDDDAKQWLRLSLQETQQARKHYEDGNRTKGMESLQRAEEHFTNAFSKKTTSARFVVGDSGAAMDEQSGFPQ